MSLLSHISNKATSTLRDLGTMLDAGAANLLAPKGLKGAIGAAIKGAPRNALIGALHAARIPNSPAFIHGDKVVTWTQLHDRVSRLSRVLALQGVGPTSGVAIACTNRPEFIETQQAGLILGARVCFISPKASRPEAEELMSRSGSVALVTSREDLQAPFVLQTSGSYEQALAAAPDTEIAKHDGTGRVVIFTSGTTGRPKGAVRNLDNAANLTAFAGFLRAVPFKTSDRHLVACPLYHSSGSGFASATLVLGSPLIFCEHFSPDEFCRLVQKHKATTTAVVPAMLQQIIKVAANYDLSSLRVVVCTGSPLRDEVRAAAREKIGDVIFDLYGSTEMGWVSVASPIDQRQAPGCVGKPVGGIEVSIRDENGAPMPTGETGEIWTKSAIAMESYLDDKELSSDRMRDGFVSVKDVGYLDANGYLYIVDRSDDMIISGGVNVYPAETEIALMSHPAVVDVAAFGMPDERWGQKVVAAVVVRETTTPEALIEWSKAHASYAAVPKQVQIMDDLPRNEIGKTDKKELAKKWS